MSRPKSVWCPSPNFRASTNARKVTCVVIHATATAGLASPKEWLCNPASKVSAHYLVDVDGTIYQLVGESNIAWHAGVSEWKGQKNVNAFSVGLELVNDNKGGAWPGPQIVATVDLVAAICLERGISADDVIGHKDIAPGRKTDPAGFPFDEVRALLREKGVA